MWLKVQFWEVNHFESNGWDVVVQNTEVVQLSKGTLHMLYSTSRQCFSKFPFVQVHPSGEAAHYIAIESGKGLL